MYTCMDAGKGFETKTRKDSVVAQVCAQRAPTGGARVVAGALHHHRYAACS